MERKSLLKKKELVASYRERLKKSDGFVVFFNFEGIDAFPFSQLRAKVREVGGEIVVGRNTLLYRAFEDTPLVDHRDLFIGPSAALFAYKDPVATTKVLVSFLKDSFDKEYESKLKGGLLNGRYMTPEETVALAELPGIEELIAKLMGVLVAPMTRLAFVLKAVPQKLVLTLKAIEEKKP
ncbi:MAG TPA: 50S ribosomal protein L10 [Aquifex aeolicus]|nr:50S ribosomal protein L10 [Aquifex aeolicus]